MGILRLIGGLLDRLCVVIGAFIGSQIPAFMQQYNQRLAGHVAELNQLMEWVQESAARSGKTLDQYIYKFLNNPDPDFAQQGEFMRNMVSRWETLSTALRHLAESSMWSKPFVFVQELQYDIAKSTFFSFQPSLVLTVEGLCYTALGLVLGYTIYQIVAKLLGYGAGHAAAVFRQSV